LEWSYIEHSDSESYSDTDREVEFRRSEIGDVDILRCPTKQNKVSIENLLISFQQFMNLMPEAHLWNLVYLFEDLTELDCFKTMLPDYTMDVFITETNEYAHQVHTCKWPNSITVICI
jgi:hypothetical protein